MTTRTILALAAGLAAGCGHGRDPSLIQASGHVEATDVRISTKVGGRLTRFAQREGDPVAAGQELAEISTTDARLALRQVQAKRAQAEADLPLRLAGARKKDIAFGSAQLAIVQVGREAA